MREIEFRGKLISDGRWVYGHIQAECLVCIDTALTKHPVYPETVGQYVNRKDKNGMKIFEGDIVKRLYGVGYSSTRHPSFANNTARKNIGVIEYNSEFAGYEFLTAPYDFNFECEYEVVGNIHDNPELLKERT